jgi:hypothetical protein
VLSSARRAMNDNAALTVYFFGLAITCMSILSLKRYMRRQNGFYVAAIRASSVELCCYSSSLHPLVLSHSSSSAIVMKLFSLALLSLTALVGAQSVSTVVDGLNALTKSFQSSDFDTGHVSSFSAHVDDLAAQIQDFTTVSALRYSQINGGDADSALSRVSVLWDRSAVTPLLAYSLLVPRSPTRTRRKLSTPSNRLPAQRRICYQQYVPSVSLCFHDVLIGARMCADHSGAGRDFARGPSPADVRQPGEAPAGKPGAPPCAGCAEDCR